MQSYWNKNASIYDSVTSFEESYLNELSINIVDLSTKKSCENTKILDLACGTGKFIQLLKNNSSWKNFTTTDYSEEMVSLSKQNGYNSFVLDINDIDKITEKYDIVIIKFAVHFITNLSDFMKKINNILQDKGRLYIITRPKYPEFPYSEGAKKRFADCQKDINEILEHVDSSIFTTVEHKLTFPIEINQPFWRHMLINKFYSNINDEDSVEAEKMEINEKEFIRFNDIIIVGELIKK